MNVRLTTVGFLGLGLTLNSPTAEAQSWRSLTTSRQVRGETSLDVDVQFASGTLLLHPGSRGSLFRVEARYDEDTFVSSTSYDPEESHLLVKVTLPDEFRGDFDLAHDSPQYLDLALSPAVSLSLDLKFGAARSDIELGGLAVRRASVKTGASDSQIGFERPNQTICEEFEVAVGAAELTVYGIGNARCREFKLAGGAGDVTIDFTGSWPAGFLTDAEVTMGFGSLRLLVPENVGIELTMSRLLASFDKEGFEKRGSRWVSRNYDEAAATLRLHVRAVLGDVSVDWVAGR